MATYTAVDFHFPDEPSSIPYIPGGIYATRNIDEVRIVKY